MTTDARDLLNRSIFLGSTTFVPVGFTIDFNPILEIEQTSTQARNFVFLDDTESLFLNDGFVRDFVDGSGDGDVVIGNTGVIGSSGRADPSITLTGFGQRAILNEGDILGGIQLGQGDDLVYTAGLIDGDVRTGGGNDIVLILDFMRGGETFNGEITGTLNTGSGDDVVVNGGSIGSVSMGSGNDVYNSLIVDGQIGQGGSIRGGTGNDIIFGGSGAERIAGQAGKDQLNGHGGDDWIFGGNNRDTIGGGEGDDILVGGKSKDILLGGKGDDTLQGDTGQDVVSGGRGDDILEGGSGADTFNFFTKTNGTLRDVGNDTITDFSAEDKVALTQVFKFEDVAGDLVLTPQLTFELIENTIVYAGGAASLSLNDLFEAAGLEDFVSGQPNSITWLDIAAGSLTEDNFIL